MTILLSAFAIFCNSFFVDNLPKDQPVDMNSVRSLDRKIARLFVEEREDRLEGRGKKAEHEKEAADYLKAYRYFLARRAFPGDRLDWSAYTRAQVHAAAMRPTSLGGSGGTRPMVGQGWQYVGPTNLAVPYQQYYGNPPVSGRINAVAYDPNNSQTIYAGGAQGGLWKSTDSGATWSWLSASWTQIAVNCIVVDPSNSQTIYVGRGDYHGFIAGSNGIMKSTDGGATWNEIAIATMGNVGVAKILLDPTNSQTIIAGTGDTNSYGRLYRSINGGQTWTKLTVGGTDFTWPALAASVPNSGKTRFYAIAGGIAKTTGAASRVYKSDDHGVTWQLLTSQILADGNFHWAYCVAASPTNPNNVYILDSENQLLFRSASQGASWTNASANLPTGSQDYNFSQNFYDYHLECGTRVNGITNNDVLFLGEIDVAESTDGGNTWISVGGPSYAANGAITHNDQHALAPCPTNPNLALFSNDGGIYSLSFDPSTSQNIVTPLNKNMGVSMFYKIAFHPTNANYMIGGTQDNATPVSTGDLSNWINVGGGDGGGSAINQTNPLVQFTSSEDLVIFRTATGWNSFFDISPTPLSTENLPFVATVTLSPQNQSLMYTGSNFLYRWNDTTQSWTNRLGGQDLTNKSGNQPVVQAIAISPQDGNRIYTGSDDGALWMTTDQGSTWKHLNAAAGSLPVQSINAISVSPTNENDILIGMGGTGKGNAHMFRCSNTTAATPTFTAVSGSGSTGLPDIPLNAIARDLDDPAGTWWVGMDVGVFQTKNSGATWTNAGSTLGLPNVIVDDLVAVPGTRYLNAGTYGRGMWRMLLPSASSPTLASLTLSTSSVRRGNNVTGTVTLTAPAPTGGAAVTLSSSNPLLVSVPPAVTVQAGATSASFVVTTFSTTTSPGSATITASYASVQLQQTLNVTMSNLSRTITFV